MRITELLDKRSISLSGAPKSKNEALDQVVDLMVKSSDVCGGIACWDLVSRILFEKV